MQAASFAVLALLAVLVGRSYARSRPPGYQSTLRDRAVVGLTFSAIGCIAIGVAVVFGFKFAPEVTFFDRVARGLTVAGIGLAPFALFFFITFASRVVRHWEIAYRRRHLS
jgi:hypothetical protein